MAGIEVDGFEELEEFLNDFKLDPVQEKQAMREALNLVKAEVEPQIPKRTGDLRESQKLSVRQSKGLTTGTYKLTAYYARFLEVGTSKSKKHVGFFSRAIRGAEDKAIEVLGKKLLK